MSNKSLMVSGSVAKVAKDKGVDVMVQFAEMVASGEALMVICDTSGSMSVEDTPHGSRFNAVDAELAKLQAEYPGQVIVVSYSDQATFCFDGIPHRFSSGTTLIEALKLIEDFSDLVTLCILSDGVDDAEEEAYEWVSKNPAARINTVYIGSEDDNCYDRSMEFLGNLAKRGNGQASKTVQPGMVKAIVKNMNLLRLAPPQDEKRVFHL